MRDRYEIRLTGTGGQGLVLAGIILAEAAGIYEGKYVVQTVSYGPSARGGTSRADVVISDEEIKYYYTAHTQQFTLDQPMVRLQQILVKTQKEALEP